MLQLYLPAEPPSNTLHRIHAIVINSAGFFCPWAWTKWCFSIIMPTKFCPLVSPTVNPYIHKT